MNRKSISAIVAILVAAIVGAYACSTMSSGSFQLGEIETVGSFIIEADELTITGVSPTMILQILSYDDSQIPAAFANQCEVELINMVLTKVEDGRTLEIKSTKVTGTWVAMHMESLEASSAEFIGLTIVDDPFEQSATGTVVMEDVEIHAIYMFAQTQTLEGMELNVYD